ncbi:PREDICTED: CSC1-like protein At1g10090 isoform X1 [Camelina sativa]|uniref:CSC1-like protein At1g10090 isoform X1 n=1 Tax=Camelina sativa TaxID=90675 RepID=A0ABM0XT51_CAMSA|nr:PREDICTED: CSC1-like protein At1g10090 isoform X1 [Camelina sativa]
MDVAALLTSAGINVAICIVLVSLYSILRKQPANYCVYFGRMLSSGRVKRHDPHWYERFAPSPSWLLKAWETTEEEMLAAAGLDAVVLIRMVICSIRIFSIVAVVCIAFVLPVNYYGQKMEHKEVHLESLGVFTIENLHQRSRWLWVHCLSLYIISSATCALLYFEYKNITKRRLAHIAESASKPSHFTVLIRAIPQSPEHSYSETVSKYFTNYYAPSYVSHLMVYRDGFIQRLRNETERMCQAMKHVSSDLSCNPSLKSCTFCGPAATNSFQILSNEADSMKTLDLGELTLATTEEERPVAFVFFKSRYDALVVSEVLQTPNPMLWVADLAPEPHDVHWRNLRIPYRQLWMRRIATLVGAIAFMFVFLFPVAFVQGLTQLQTLSKNFPFLKDFLNRRNFVNQIITGYLPSVILVLFFYAVPPLMMYFSTLEGCVSRSLRKKSACIKILYFTIWNVFFVNILSGSVIRQLAVLSSVRDIPAQLAKLVPAQAGFFMTYCFTSGWAGLACEIMQPVGLIWNLIRKVIVKNKEDSYETLRFPYHTEIPRLLLFGLLGFTNSVIAPLILPFLLIYFFFAYLVYKNQIINVYITKYESGGQYWPVFHNTTIFSLILSQVIALGFFGLKLSTVASGFTIPLILLTLLFSEYCRQRFAPIFQKYPAEILIAMDRADEVKGKMDEIHNNLKAAYSQIPSLSCSQESSKAGCSSPGSDQELSDSEQLKPEKESLKAEYIWAFQRSKSGHDLEVKSCPSASPNRYSPGFAEIYKRT